MATEPLRVQVATFNAGQKLEEDALPNLTSWLIPTISEDPSSGYATLPNLTPGKPEALAMAPRAAPDLYAVGFQEIAPLPHALAGLTESLHASIDREIRRTVRLHQATVRSDNMYDPEAYGGGPENYARVAEATLGGITLFVYARENSPGGAKHLPSTAQRVKEVRMASVGTGILELMGNKGAVGVRVTLAPVHPAGKDEVFTFVCAHLAAHDHNVERRNADWQNIVQRLVFDASNLGYKPNVAPRTRPGNEKEMLGQVQSIPMSSAADCHFAALDQNEYSVYDTHHLFVLGDLNYRIGTDMAGAPPSGGPPSPNTYPPMKRADIKMLARSNNPKRWAWLLPYDQLLVQRAASPPRAFQSLFVPDMTQYKIPPTYKYKVPTLPSNPRNTLSTKRIPGWPDRILWNDSSAITCELYRSLMQYGISDHKPITAIVSVPKAEGAFLTPPYPIHPRWRTLQRRGYWLDRIVGYVWSVLLFFGNGSLPFAAVEMVLLAILGAWWISGQSISLIRPSAVAR